MKYKKWKSKWRPEGSQGYSEETAEDCLHSHLAVDDVRSSSLTEPTYRIGAFYIYKYLPTPNPFVINLLWAKWTGICPDSRPLWSFFEKPYRHFGVSKQTKSRDRKKKCVVHDSSSLSFTGEMMLKNKIQTSKRSDFLGSQSPDAKEKKC